ncbi:MAG: hypothetical protein IBX50_12545 [Marinospirillum sp.]|uniref:hypothetical protein n=1 Tax=Marinospirillum sp. TaxID=2183934 RepID=UPI001A09B757|nr:hypothetical protein [Marinospirillum sp.]MBE0507526.1 hypothetical protein [Marinospirillum sp.]
MISVKEKGGDLDTTCPSISTEDPWAQLWPTEVSGYSERFGVPPAAATTEEVVEASGLWDDMIPTPSSDAVAEDWVIIGVDTEYVALTDTTLHILSYQYCLITPAGQSHSGIIYTPSARKNDRVKLDDFLGQAIEDAFQAGVIKRYPAHVHVATFFARADLAHFSRVFNTLKTNVQSTRRTIASLNGDNGYGIDLSELRSRHLNKASMPIHDPDLIDPQQVKVRFYDTMLLVPAGRNLDAVGQLLGLHKITIPEPYSIERMDEYLKADQAGFEAYAIRDAEIPARYLLWMMAFAQAVGTSRVPATIGGLAVSLFRRGYIEKYSRAQLLQSFNLTEQSRLYWPRDDGLGGVTPKTQVVQVPHPAYADFEQLAVNCYHGGYNISFEMGPSEIDEFNDFDIRSAYTTALQSIRPLDFDNLRYSTQVEDYVGDQLGLAYISFRFPTDCRHPSLPVRTDKHGLIYPLAGTTHCTLHEIELAVTMGCEISVHYGFIIPWASDHAVFGSFMQLVREKRNSHAKGSLEELLWKELGNSVYGKTAQGLRAKTGFELQSGLSKKIPRSAITHPFFAAYTTGVVRALLHELIASIPPERNVTSATTDGFLTNATLDEISLDGTMAQLFIAWHRELDPTAESILELKHGAKQVVAMKTRGQLTALRHDNEAIGPVTAKAGVRPPRGVKDGNAYVLELYLNRQPGQLVDASHLISTREQFTLQSDLIMKRKEQRLSLEFDFKRDLVNPVIRKVGEVEHLACSSVPFRTVEEQSRVRLMFDNWRRNHCLKTLGDFYSWQEYRLMADVVRHLKESGNGTLRIQRTDTLAGLYARLFCRGYMQGYWGFPDVSCRRPLSNKFLSEALEEVEVFIKPATISQSKNRPVMEGVVPYTPLLLPLLRKLKEHFASFDPGVLIRPQDRQPLDAALNPAPSS